ncbi:MAG: hypothetical protein IIA01_07270 [Proteobacteria bacterium]|nr:hypothetical protein [Pseudomonadota bacterium]
MAMIGWAQLSLQGREGSGYNLSASELATGLAMRGIVYGLIAGIGLLMGTLFVQRRSYGWCVTAMTSAVFALVLAGILTNLEAVREAADIFMNARIHEVEEAAQLAADKAAEEEDDGGIDIANIEGRVKDSSIRKIGEIVDTHPEEALAIIRNWLYQEA